MIKLVNLNRFERDLPLSSIILPKTQKNRVKVSESQIKEIISKTLNKYKNSEDIVQIKNSDIIKHPILKLALNYYNNKRNGKFKGKDSENVSLAILIWYVSTLVSSNNKNKIRDEKLKQKINNFLNAFQLIPVSLSTESKLFTIEMAGDRYEKLDNKEQKLEEYFTGQISQSLTPRDCIDLLKYLLNKLNITLTTKDATLAEIEDFSISGLALNAYKRAKQKCDDNYFEKISIDRTELYLKNAVTELFDNFNDLINYLLIVNRKDFNLSCPWLLSLLFSNRAIFVGKKPDAKRLDEVSLTIQAEGVTEPSLEEIEEILPDLDRIVEELVKPIKESVPKIQEQPLELSEFLFVSGKSGPNGQSSILNIPYDAKALLKNPDLLKSIIDLGEEFGIKINEEMLEELSKMPVPDSNYKLPSEEERKSDSFDHDQDEYDQWRHLSDDEVTDSKLDAFIELGDKLRVVAQVDSITQTVLTPIHNILSSISRSLGNKSGHFDQQAAFEQQVSRAIENGFIGTVDLKSATDLLYLNIQELIMSKIFKNLYDMDDLGILWGKVISRNRIFKLKVGDEIRDIQYNVGQPMGAKSSWVMMHLTMVVLMRQAVINFSEVESGFDETELFKEVNATGDDLSISMEDIYREFFTLCKDLKLFINEEKSFHSVGSGEENNDKHYLCGEYLKKYLLNGNLVLPLPARRSSKFIISPRKFFNSMVFSLSALDLDFDYNDLLMYASLKVTDSMSDSINYDTSLDVEEIVNNYFHLSEQSFFILVYDIHVGGVNAPAELIQRIVDSGNEVFIHFLDKYKTDGMTDRVMAKMVDFKARLYFSKAKNRAENAIKNVFSNKTLKAIKGFIREADLKQQEAINNYVLNNNFDILVNAGFIPEDIYFGDDDERKSIYFKNHPFYTKILHILFNTLLEVEQKITDLRNKLDSYKVEQRDEEECSNIIHLLVGIEKRAKKEFTIIDPFDLLREFKEQESAFPSDLSEKVIQKLKENTFVPAKGLGEDAYVVFNPLEFK